MKKVNLNRGRNQLFAFTAAIASEAPYLFAAARGSEQPFLFAVARVSQKRS
jgi:hypothetical protein